MIDKTQMTLHGSVLTVPGELGELIAFAVQAGFKQFSFADDNGWKLSAPLDDKQKVAYTWLFHKTKGLQKPPEPPKGGGNPPDGTPPQGGSPAAGQQYVEPELLMAVA
jgi:hypothetical protein